MTKLKKLAKKKSKVQAAHFDALFAKGMAMSAHLETDDGKEYLAPAEEKLFKSALKPAGYTEKVLSYLDDQGQPKTSTGDLTTGQGHTSRDRNRKRQQPIKQVPDPIISKDRSMSTEQRNRSREYTRPEDIKLSPMPKQDLFTGSLVPDSPQAMFLQRVTDFVAENQKGYMEKAIQITGAE